MASCSTFSIQFFAPKAEVYCVDSRLHYRLVRECYGVPDAPQNPEQLSRTKKALIGTVLLEGLGECGSQHRTICEPSQGCT